MRIFKYHFTEYGEMPPDYKPQTRETTAANAQHARFRIMTKHPPTAPNRYWQITKVEIIDLEMAPPGFIPPSWMWKDKRWKKKFRDDVGHCIREMQHRPHIYRTEAGRPKVCPGDARTLNPDELEEAQRHRLFMARADAESVLRKPHVNLENYNMLKGMNYIDKQIARHWGISVPELHAVLDELNSQS